MANDNFQKVCKKEPKSSCEEIPSDVCKEVNKEVCKDIPISHVEEVVERNCTVVFNNQCFPYAAWECHAPPEKPIECKEVPEEVCEDMKETVTKMEEEEVCKYETETKCHEEKKEICHDTKVSVPQEETEEVCETKTLKKCDGAAVKCETIFIKKC